MLKLFVFYLQTAQSTPTAPTFYEKEQPSKAHIFPEEAWDQVY